MSDPFPTCNDNEASRTSYTRTLAADRSTLDTRDERGDGSDGSDGEAHYSWLARKLVDVRRSMMWRDVARHKRVYDL
jgi:hypothetical protein